MKRLIPVLILLTVLAASCTRKVYGPMTHTVTCTDTLLQRTVQRDSIMLTDSVIIYVNGDTVRIRERSTAWRERTVTDTLREKVEVRDTVPVPVEVEKPLSAWQRTKQDWGGWAILGCVLLLATVIFAPARKK